MKVLIIYGKEVLLDDSDFDNLKDRRWCLNKGKYNLNWYAMYGVRIGKKVKKVYLHRLISGAGPGDRVEFSNNNSLDCQKHNLIKNGKRIG
ncbi:MAG: hypothetical protein ACWGNI_00345 [Desulfobacterales bacterium]